MKNLPGFFDKCKYIIVLLLLFLAPFSYFPLFANVMQINLIYIFTFGTTLLLILSVLQLLIAKKPTLHRNTLDIPIIVFLCGIFLSFLISATNKIQALLDPDMGLMLIASVVIFYFYSRTYAKNNLFSSILSFSAFVISSIVIFLSLEPVNNLIVSFQLVIFLGFILLYNLGTLFIPIAEKDKGQASKIAQIFTTIIISIAFAICLFRLLQLEIMYPSYSLSLKAFLEILKNPISSLFGIGTDNYSVIFNRVKDLAFNQTDLWQYYQNSDRSTLFHVATTTGIAGLASFIFLLFSLIKKTYFVSDKKIRQNFSVMLGLAGLMCAVIIFPPSSLIFFLLIYLASLITKEQTESVVDLTKSLSLYSSLILIITACVLFGAVIKYVGTFALADYFNTQSLTGIKNKDLKTVYNNQLKTLVNNPYQEQYHFAFSRTHMQLANNIIDHAATGSADINQKSLVLNKESKQQLTEAIQVAINENQAAISLNPKKAEYWSNLAQIFTMIPKELQTPEDKGANSPKAMALNFYNKAIELDPNNPGYYFAISKLYTAQQNTDEGFKYINRAIEKKSNLAPAHYELAMYYGQKHDKENTIKELQTTLKYIDPKKNQKDYDDVKQLLDAINNSPQQQPQKPSYELAPPSNQLPPQTQMQPPPAIPNAPK